MKPTFRPITEADVYQFTQWRYEPPYDIYNEGDELSDEDLAYFLEPEYRYHAMLNEMGDLIAYCSFGKDGQVPGGDYGLHALDIGMGVRPDLTGQGNGIDFAQAAIDFALDTYTPPALRVTIAQFNERAQKVWRKAGFEKVSHFGRAGDDMVFALFLYKP